MSRSRTLALGALVAGLTTFFAGCSSGAGGGASSGSTSSGASSSGASSSGASSSASSGASGSSGAATTCGAQAIPPAVSGGCAPRVVTPTACELVDLSAGNTYELAWTTDGTGCETPWKVCVAGNPVTDPNSRCSDISVDVNAGISRTGGVLRVSAADLEGLASDNGVYHVLIASFFQSHNGSVAFRVSK